MGYYTPGQKLITKNDVISRSEGPWGPRNINHGRVKFAFKEEWWSERDGCVMIIGTDENGSEFRWPEKDVTSYYEQPLTNT